MRQRFFCKFFDPSDLHAFSFLAREFDLNPRLRTGSKFAGEHTRPRVSRSAPSPTASCFSSTLYGSSFSGDDSLGEDLGLTLTLDEFLLISVKTEMNLDPVIEKLVMHWGEMGARWGISRMVAQIHALLYFSPKPMAADEIVEALGVARSHVSNSLKELPVMGGRQGGSCHGRPAGTLSIHQGCLAIV